MMLKMLGITLMNKMQPREDSSVREELLHPRMWSWEGGSQTSASDPPGRLV